MSEVESLSDLPAWKADRTLETADGTKFLRRSEPTGAALHHYAGLGERATALERIEQEVDEELARLNDDTGGDE